MRVLQAWKDSLTLFSPNNLKLFLLVTLNAFIKGYAVLIRSAWPFLLAFIGLWVLAKATFVDGNMNQGVLTRITEGFFSSFLLFLWCVATRPSVERKSIAYFIFYLKRFWYLIFILFFWGFGYFQISPFVLVFFASLVQVQVFFVFFVLDGDSSVQSLWLSCIRTLKMTWYNLPAFILFFLILIILSVIFSILLLLFPWLSWSFFYLRVLALLLIWGIAIPFQVCFFSNYYIKKLHDQFDLYFKQP